MPAPAPWPVSQDAAPLAGRARALSRAGDLEALADALLRIQPPARDLERRGLPSGGGHEADALRAWLAGLRDDVFDAEDLLDELHRRRQASSALSACVGAVAFRRPLARELRRLVGRLDRARDDSDRLLPALAAAAGGGTRSLDRVTGSVLAERRVFGREAECEDIIGKLIGGCKVNHASVAAPVVAVVGHGGMGKTTVAQCVYNVARIEEHFDLRAWVCVWDRSDEAELTREILQSIGGADDMSCDDDLFTLEMLQEKLEQFIAAKRVLLVLDDVWIDEGKTKQENRAVWNNVLKPLRSASGSLILVTTRMKLVAEVLNATHVVPLDGLRSSDCWLLFKEASMGGETVDLPPEFQEIGRAIAEKVRGSPLVAKSLGQMLRNTRSTRKWRAPLNTEICDNIIIYSLQLSYLRLPGHLQRCFAFCSMFPMTWRLNRYRLVKMWIALGFVQPLTEEGKSVEDLGQGYFDDLLSRSFFRTANKDQHTYYFLDDLMYILGQHFSAHDCMKVNEGIPVVIPHTVHHLSISSDYLPLIKSQYSLRRLRTLLVLRSSSLSLNHFPSKLLAKFKNLRVLDLTESDIVELPETISELVHLHYLALCCLTNKLPKCIDRLEHLEVLDMPVVLYHGNHPRSISKSITRKHLKTCCIHKVDGGNDWCLRLRLRFEFHSS